MRIDDLLARAVEMFASDLHVSVGCQPTFRVHGRLVKEGQFITVGDIRLWTDSILTERQKTSLQQEGQTDFAYSTGNLSRFRCNAFLTSGEIGLAIRMIQKFVPSLTDLGLPDILQELSKTSQGLILVTGPTGSGKSTTLAAILREINTRLERHIITLEDPIEYCHENDRSVVHQREVGRDTLSFSVALRSALRQDPDVIMVGELRDLETVRTAVTASETGHLVLASLHTGDAVQTIDRLIDMFPSDQQPQIRAQLADVLCAVVSQRLLPQRSEVGRVALVELLLNTPAVANLIRTQKTHQLRSVMQTSRQSGMQTFEMAARDLVQAGRISDEISRDWLSVSS